MAETKALHDALVDELRDLYHAEKQLVRALPKMARAAGRDELRDALENHRRDRTPVDAARTGLRTARGAPRAKPCEGMAGIIEGGSELLKGDFPEAVMDAQMPRAARKGWRKERTEPPGTVEQRRRRSEEGGAGRESISDSFGHTRSPLSGSAPMPWPRATAKVAASPGAAATPTDI